MKSDVLTKLILVAAALVLLIMIAMSIEPFFGSRINPVALTRHTLEQCERLEVAVIEAGRKEATHTELPKILGRIVSQSSVLKEGYVKLSKDTRPIVLDGWGRPLQVIARDNLVNIRDASGPLLRKTNSVVIWSFGRNGTNEYGNGDDIFLP